MRPVLHSNVVDHPAAGTAKLRADYRALKERIRHRRELDIMDDTLAKKDTRPEGSLLLQATMYGALEQAKYLAIQTASAGYFVHIDTAQRSDLRGINLTTITATKGESENV